MNINVTINCPGLAEKLDRILAKLEKVMATLSDFEAKFTAVTDQVAKAAAEIVAEIVAEIDALKKAIEDGAQTTPAIDASLERLTGLAQALDDLNPDAP